MQQCMACNKIIPVTVSVFPCQLVACMVVSSLTVDTLH